MTQSCMTFKEHMENRATVFSDCLKVTVGHDFAVFEFEDAFDTNKALKFAVSCNKMYKYTFDSNLTNKLVCFDV